MFSGIVVEVGTIEAVEDGILRVRAGESLRRSKVGGSIAVNGVCLTAARIDGDLFSADVMPETLRRSGLGSLRPGARVNLEPALGFGDEVGGHLVQGHVDGVGEVVEVRDEGNARWLQVRVPPEVREYCVLKGSIAIDGTSLTIAVVEGDVIGVSLVPHTLRSTIASAYAPGTIVNLEADVLAKYVARYLAQGRGDNDERGTTMGPTAASVDVSGGHPNTENH
jgi:riboflavin synthase